MEKQFRTQTKKWRNRIHFRNPPKQQASDAEKLQEISS